jgi:maltose O-acetyltransferase
VWGRPRIANAGSLLIGERVRIRSVVIPCEFVVRPGARLEIGDHVFINYGASFCAYKSIRVGNGCVLGTYVIILDNDEHDMTKRELTPPAKPVVLEDDVWIGDRVIILKGVRIGRNAVIGAGSVVTRDIPPYTVAAGVPARVLRELQPSEAYERQLLAQGGDAPSTAR